MPENEEPQYSIKELKELYNPVRGQIENRLHEFGCIWENANDEELFTELVFCLLTPQSKAKTCWNAILRLKRKGMIFNGDACLVQDELFGVRFNKRKAEYICLARKTFSLCSIKSTLREFSNSFDAREWLVNNILGLGYKEASHFLRNIGFGLDLAILDRHILKNLVLLNVIDEIPASLSKKAYLEIEKKMTRFSIDVGIPMAQLDLLLWYKEAGEVFK
jgi:N-glycosylase/DNA lyase